MSNLKDRPDNIGRLQEKLAKKNLDGTSIKEIQRNEPFLIAYTGVFDGYIVDMTRMFVIAT